MSMSEDRGLQLQRQVLSKLMLLEYLKPEFFKQLATLQAAQMGHPVELSRAEEFLRQSLSEENVGERLTSEEAEGDEDGKAVGKGRRRKITASSARRGVREQTDLPAEIQSWLADQWMQRWIAADPTLSDIDLRPYFYVAHDKAGVLDDAQTRLSPAAAEVLNRLLDAREGTRTIGLRRAESLSAPDATALFESLARRLRQAESLDSTSPQQVIFKLTEHRPELVPQVVALFGSLPETKVTAATPRAIQAVTRNTSSAAAAQGLLARWAKSSNQVLARASAAVLASQANGK
jgi:hypothetical protein